MGVRLFLNNCKNAQSKTLDMFYMADRLSHKVRCCVVTTLRRTVLCFTSSSLRHFASNNS